MVERLLLLWLILSSWLAYVWPELGWDADPFLAVKPAIGWLIAATMFVLGSLLPRDEVTQVIRNWKVVLAGVGVQFGSMPALAFAVGYAFQLPEDLRIGVMVTGCVPGAMASNVLTLAARGNVSYSVSLTTLATLLSPIAVPLALLASLGSAVDYDPLSTAYVLVTQVAGPVVFGHLLSRLRPGYAVAMAKIGPAIANLTILIIIAVVVALNRDRLAAATGTIVVVLLALNVLGYLAGYFGGRLLKLDSPMQRALTLEVGMQNAGVGTLLALQLFPDRPGVAIPTAASTFGGMLTGTLLAQVWSRFPVGSTTAEVPSPTSGVSTQEL